MDFFVIYMILFFLMVFTLIIIHEKNKIRTNDSITQRYIFPYLCGGIAQFYIFLKFIYDNKIYLTWQLFFMILIGGIAGILSSNNEFLKLKELIINNKIMIKKSKPNKILIVCSIIFIINCLLYELKFAYAEYLIRFAIFAGSFVLMYFFSMIIKILKYERAFGKIFMVK